MPSGYFESSRQHETGTRVTAYLKNSGKLEVAQQIANHESPRTTKLYDRRNDEISLDEIERITIKKKTGVRIAGHSETSILRHPGASVLALSLQSFTFSPTRLSTVENLNLAPHQHQEEVLKTILGNCQSVVNYLGAIRNKIGDAHG
jgi:hypothetical protein